MMEVYLLGYVEEKNREINVYDCNVNFFVQITMRGGSPHRLAGGYIFHAVQYILHEKYDAKTFDYDVAVVQIAENFLVGTLRAVSLADSTIKVNCPSELATVIGWGTDAYSYVPLILQELRVLVQTNDVCQKLWIEQITDR